MGVVRNPSMTDSNITVSEGAPGAIGNAATATTAEALPVPGKSTATLDRIYAVFSDGSLEIWAVQRPHQHHTLSSARLVVRTLQATVKLDPLSVDGIAGELMRSVLWSRKSESFVLAIADLAGHIFLLSAASTGEGQLLNLCDLWDGHKEPIFHISVDPYSQRIATHSTEGELLIWDSIDAESRAYAISRQMALDGSQIRTIAWAPTDHEFIAATGKRVYRLIYSKDMEQWTPCDSSLPSMDPYDRIFTYPANSIEELADESIHTRPYYISTVTAATRATQTWIVTESSDHIELVDSSVLKKTQCFDHASRVMPVAHPFFSRDNIMATFDSSAGKLQIWGIRTSPKFMWFCAKEHRLPCLNVDMIRYNSIDKAAIVSTDSDGLQTVTVWVFSSASRRSHYLPAGTIYPQNKSDRVQEVRWHLTEYAQTYLGIQWDDRVDIYCQERNIDGGWRLAHTILASEFGPDKTIGSFSFTEAGNPTFSIGRQLFVHSLALQDGRTISDVAYEEHGELPLIHPFVLTELLSWGRVDAVRQLLAMLHDYIRELSIDSSRDVALPLISMQDLLAAGADESSSHWSVQDQSGHQKSSKYAALLDTSLDSDTLTMDDQLPDFGKLTQEKADYVAEKLTEVKIKGLDPIDQARLLSIVGSISASQIKDQPLDGMGVRYLIKLQLLELENKRTRTAAELPYRELNWALHSNSQAILLQLCLQRHASSGLTWESARQMGICVWLSDVSALRDEVDKMARNMFVADGRDPTRCAIFYLALGKQRLLHGLWRMAHTHPEHSKMLAFLSHDFSEPRWRTAAAKNAYVLLSRQRYLDAATFFLLSGKLADAATICITQLHDIQLAIAICRCREGDAGPVLKDILWRLVLPDALKRQDRWLASLAFGLVHRYDLILQALTDDLAKLGKQIGVDAELSSYSAMDVLDTELLILYRSMLNYSSQYRAPLAMQAELIAQTITIFECLGAPIMSLVVLEWWRKELYKVTKETTSVAVAPVARKTTTSAYADANAVSGFESGIPDMSAFAGFAGFGTAQMPSATPASDSVASVTPANNSAGSVASEAPPHRDADLTASAGDGNTEHAEHADTLSSNCIEDDSLLAVDIEDTPVQYACRVTLALQIMEFVVRSKSTIGGPAAIDIEKEKRIIADTLRLPQSIFPVR
ncbi:regulator of (H+)-ATPase in vacuolar membrane [Coemansia guatemalensis]|uniref:Regulator of (H+)-ATPase in vacuolar membrane n=1 Tax=Coemansia guatemalensis TaxID=2761395 RepID=A0A9W8HXB3_9FUNG|nr:regulator of (H+)-ATPase in vacuolar membrane [Coemansia guatemalensis]